MNIIICPVRNGLHYTRNAMKDFLDQDIGDVRVLVIDNASRDGTAAWLATLDNRVSTAHFEKPLSVAASWNYGLRWVFSQGAEYCLVVNNDVRLREDTYSRLVEDEGGFVTAVGTKDAQKIKPKPELENKLIANWCRYEQPDPAAKRPHPDFSCYLIRHWVWDKVGPFNENFKVGFCEDWDMHVRLHKAGVEAYCLDLPFLHYASQTVALMADEERRLVQDQAGRNREYFKELHGFEGGSTEYYEFFNSAAP